MGGNAQSITKEGWLHHTSFLWDWQDAHMDYLTLPSKRPEYRQDRNHEDFLVKLNQYYESPKVFFETFKEVCEDEYELETVNLRQVMGMVNEKFGGLQAWFDTKSRNKFVDL
jgi:lipoate-protein ligase A